MIVIVVDELDEVDWEDSGGVSRGVSGAGDEGVRAGLNALRPPKASASTLSAHKMREGVRTPCSWSETLRCELRVSEDLVNG